MKYIFITGRIKSLPRKGLTSGALGALLEQRGLTTRIQKIRPLPQCRPWHQGAPFHIEKSMSWTMVETDLERLLR